MIKALETCARLLPESLLRPSCRGDFFAGTAFAERRFQTVELT